MHKEQCSDPKDIVATEMGDRVKLPCPAGSSCDFVTIELPYEQANQQLTSHISIAHAAATVGQAANKSQAERVKRPTLSMQGNSMEQADYDHFTMLYNRL